MGLDKEQELRLERLYNEMYTALLLYARGILGEQGWAEEAVQETFRIACEKPDSLLASENPRGWLVNTLKNVIRNGQRARCRLHAFLISITKTEEARLRSHEGDAEMGVLYSSLIGEEDYRLLKRVVLDGYSMLEAAQELGITLEACKKRVQRIKKKAKKILENEP